MRGDRTWRMGRGSSLLWGVPRRPMKLLGCGSRRVGWPQIEGECFLGLVAFQRLWLWMFGQWNGGRLVLF